MLGTAKSSNPSKPNQETGLQLHAASGKVSAQAQSGPLKITADQTVTVASITKSITIAAKKHVLLTAGGAYLKIQGGNIEIHGPGAMAFKASMREVTGPMSSKSEMVQFPNPTGMYAEQFQFKDELGAVLPNTAHALETSSAIGKVQTATEGNSQRINSPTPEKLVTRLQFPKLIVGKDTFKA